LFPPSGDDEKTFCGVGVRSMGESETKKVHEIDGYLVETDSSVRLLTGPVVGEVGLPAQAPFRQSAKSNFN
jgi:hypothetical protein